MGWSGASGTCPADNQAAAVPGAAGNRMPVRRYSEHWHRGDIRQPVGARRGCSRIPTTCNQAGSARAFSTLLIPRCRMTAWLATFSRSVVATIRASRMPSTRSSVSITSWTWTCGARLRDRGSTRPRGLRTYAGRRAALQWPLVDGPELVEGTECRHQAGEPDESIGPSEEDRTVTERRLPPLARDPRIQSGVSNVSLGGRFRVRPRRIQNEPRLGRDRRHGARITSRSVSSGGISIAQL